MSDGLTRPSQVLMIKLSATLAVARYWDGGVGVGVGVGAKSNPAMPVWAGAANQKSALPGVHSRSVPAVRAASERLLARSPRHMHGREIVPATVTASIVAPEASRAMSSGLKANARPNPHRCSHALLLRHSSPADPNPAQHLGLVPTANPYPESAAS